MTGWSRQRERGSAAAVRLMAWIIARLGWRASHALLYPITAYFLLSSPRQRHAARRFLRRARGREPGLGDLFGQYFAFAATLLDRAFLLSGRTEDYEISTQGLDALQARIAEGRGCILLGAHLGSFEAMRALADRGCPVEVAALMHDEHAATATAFFAALCPRRAATVISLGQPDAMLRAKECLERGGLVGILADRAPGGGKVVRVPFLGAPAAFPVGPHVLAGVLGAPVMLAFGLWRGTRRYEVRFEHFAERIVLERGAGRQASLAASVARYAARLDEVARTFPGNWFNFYDFWEEAAPEVAVPRPSRRAALLAAAVAALPPPALADTPLETLMHGFAAVRTSRADFVEEKALPELHLPLPSTGTLSWSAPDRLEKHTTDPIEEILLVEGDRLTFERPNRNLRQVLSLDQSPEIRPLVEAIRSTLAGDLPTLQRHYEIEFEGAPGAAWEMRLTPRSLRVRVAVQRVVLAGRGAAVLSVDTEGGEGTTRMRITPRP